MNSINIPTVEEIHQIAYLTMKGWIYNSYENKWSKVGFSKIKVKKRPCGCCEEEVLDDKFDLDDAYWEQQESEP